MTSSIKQYYWLKLVFLLFFFVVGITLLLFIRTKTRNQSLLRSVTAVVQEEFDKIELPNQVSEDKYVYGSECHYDYKVGATRCSVKYTKYFVANEQPTNEFIKVDNYIKELGWNGEQIFTLEEFARMQTLPFSSYKKKVPYSLEMRVRFVSDQDRQFSSQKPIEMLDQYSDEYPSIYSVSISSDIMGR